MTPILGQTPYLHPPEVPSLSEMIGAYRPSSPPSQLTRRLPGRHVPVWPQRRSELLEIFVGSPGQAGSNPVETMPPANMIAPSVYILIHFFRLVGLLAMSKRQLSITELLQ